MSAETIMPMKSGHRAVGVGNWEKFLRLQKFEGILQDGGFIWQDLIGEKGKGFFLISKFIFIVLKMALILHLSARNYPFYHF